MHTEPRAARVFLLARLSPRPGDRCRYTASNRTDLLPMSSETFRNRWPCELTRFPARADLKLAESAADLLCNVGLPRFFQADSCRIEFRNDWESLSQTALFPVDQRSDETAEWLIIADAIFDVGDDPSYYCINSEGQVNFVCISKEHGISKQRIALSLNDFAECMLGLLEWQQLTAGSLATGEAVMRLLRLVNQPCFFLTRSDERCGVCLSNPKNSCDTFLSTIYWMFSSESGGGDSFPSQIDISCG